MARKSNAVHQWYRQVFEKSGAASIVIEPDMTVSGRKTAASEPVGGGEVGKLDIRIIAVTNRDSESLVRQGRMREDFFSGMHEILVYMPLLRDRREDLPLLVDHFLNLYAGSENGSKLAGNYFPNALTSICRDGQTIGEIVMRGNNVMLDYYKDPRATREAFAGGWFHSGDLAVMHPDGYIQIMDRKKDIIISGGENISTVELENTIYQHPAVMEVAVVSTPDPKWGEVPKAYITPRPSAEPTAEDIIDFCKQNPARFKAPKHVVFGELPKTATGKIQKYKLREKEWGESQKAG